MEFPVIREIDKDTYVNSSLEDLLQTPSLNVIDAREFDDITLEQLINSIHSKRYLLFPYGVLILLSPCQLKDLSSVKRPPMVSFVHSVEDKEIYIENFYQKRKKLKSSSSLYELLIGQTWSQINDPENLEIMNELAKWKSRFHDLERENSIYEYINKHLS
tara:strand:- start:1264 stop:1743 length:480 start_codon:yes stop_codon:yes gene_type:complete